jgi:hypothetical protein
VVKKQDRKGFGCSCRVVVGDAVGGYVARDAELKGSVVAVVEAVLGDVNEGNN